MSSTAGGEGLSFKPWSLLPQLGFVLSHGGAFAPVVLLASASDGGVHSHNLSSQHGHHGHLKGRLIVGSAVSTIVTAAGL